MKNLKQKLINIDLVYDNEYLDKYLSVLNLFTDDSKDTEKHHIIPECYYKLNNLEIDHSDANLIRLSVFNHMLAHYYLFYCVKDSKLKSKLAYAFNAMKNGQQGRLLTLEETEFIENLPKYIELRNASYWKGRKRSEENIEAVRQVQYRRTPELQAKMTAPLIGQKRTLEQRKRMSEAQKNRDPSTFARGFTVPQERRDKISASLTGKKQSEETKQKRRDSISRLKWWNNGVENIRAIDCPEGYIAGRINFKLSVDGSTRSSHKGTKWFNNGLENRMAYECPEGFQPGRIKVVHGKLEKEYYILEMNKIDVN